MIWLLSAFLSFTVHASQCARYQLQGDVKHEKGPRLHLIVNKGTNSERKFILEDQISFKMAAYLDKTVRGEFITKDLKVLKVEKAELAVPDPLHHDGEMVRLAEVPCPQAKKKGPEGPSKKKITQ